MHNQVVSVTVSLRPQFGGVDVDVVVRDAAVFGVSIA
jgi:hypothetical protein